MLYKLFSIFRGSNTRSNFSKSNTASVFLGPHFSRSNEAGKCPPGTRSRISTEFGEEKGKEFAREKSGQYSEFSLSFLFFFYLLFIFAPPRKIENFSIVADRRNVLI